MKKLILGLILLTSLNCFGVSVIATNITTGTSVVKVLSSNRASVQSIQIGAGNGQVYLEVFDNDDNTTPIWGTNYTNASYVSMSSYSTNIVTTFVGMNGVTNMQTNAAIFTYPVTNAIATNALSPVFVGVVQANTVQAFNTDLLLSRGITIRVSTNCSVVFYYNPAK